MAKGLVRNIKFKSYIIGLTEGESFRLKRKELIFCLPNPVLSFHPMILLKNGDFQYKVKTLAIQKNNRTHGNHFFG